MDGLRENKIYSSGFKLKIIQEVLQGELTKEEARRKYNIKGKSAILNWIRRFDIDQTKPLKKDLIMSTKGTDIDKESLDQRIKDLTEQLKEAQLQSEAYNLMIEIAEKELNIPIRKKYNTKQSKK